MTLHPFFKLIRYPNLLMILCTQALVKYQFFTPFGVAATLNGLQFTLLVISMLCLAAAGNIINDIYDTKTDSINKPEKVILGKSISEGAAYNWFFALNLIGVGLGFYLSNLVGKPSFVALFILPSAFLYLYASQLKGTVLVGNLVVSIMVGMIIIMVGIFDLIPAITPENRTTQKVIFSILVDYGLFAFLVNFLREVVKDQEDIKGDYNAGYRTLPVILGRSRTNKVVFLLGLFPFTGVLYYIYFYLYHNQFAVLYALFLIVAPLLYFQVRILGAETSKDYHHLSRILKFILSAGILSIALYRFMLL